MEPSQITATLQFSQICQAITTNGKPCKKKSKKNACFCNTHLSSKDGPIRPDQPSSMPNSIPFKVGVSTSSEITNTKSVEKQGEHLSLPLKKNSIKEVEIREIRGIPYYIDKNGHVYKHEEIQQDNPSIIGHFNSQTGCINFTDNNG